MTNRRSPVSWHNYTPLLHQWLASWVVLMTSRVTESIFKHHLHGQTVQLRAEKIIVLQVGVGYGEKDLEVAVLCCPAQDDVEAGPAVLQEVGDGPLVSSSSWSTVGHQGDVSGMLELEIVSEEGRDVPLVQCNKGPLY